MTRVYSRPAEATGTTGTTFQGIYRYIARAMPETIILKNVRNFDATNAENMRSNMECAFRKLRKLGYTMHSVILEPRMFGEAANRSRLWMVGSLSLQPADFDVMEKFLERIKCSQDRHCFNWTRTFSYIPWSLRVQEIL